MNTKDLKSGDKIGILTRGKMSRVVIKTIDKVTPSGQVVIGKKRFNNNGQQTGVDPLIAQYLISVEEAEKIIEQWLLIEKEEEAKRDARSKTPQGIAE